jgi:putative salt-induced outer membrane protein YdiY
MKRLLLGVVSVCAAVAASADVVVMKSGAKFTGTVKHIEGGVIDFASEDAGDIKLKQENVVSMVTDEAKPVEFSDKRVETGMVACTNGTYTLDGKSLDMAGVKAVVPVQEKWHGSVNLSASAVRGNSVSETVTLFADLNRRWENDRFTASAAYYFAQSGDSKESKQKTDDRFEAFTQGDHFFTKMVYGYLNGKYEYDRIMNLDYRLRIGAGLGLQWLEGRSFESFGTWSFNQEIGASWVKERYESSFTDDYAAFRYAHHLTWVPGWLDGFTFTHNFEYLPDTADWMDNYIIDCDFGFAYAFKANWQLLGKVEWDYKSQVGEGTKHSDLRYTLGLGYKW